VELCLLVVPGDRRLRRADSMSLILRRPRNAAVSKDGAGYAGGISASWFETRGLRRAPHHEADMRAASGFFYEPIPLTDLHLPSHAPSIASRGKSP
jgi:hypothetical protein